MAAMDYETIFPSAYASEAGIWQAKGYIVVEVVTRSDPLRRYRITIHDPVRLNQDIQAEFDGGRTMFSEMNSVVVPTSTRDRSRPPSTSSLAAGSSG
jgi:hypothetical protein